MFKLIGILFGFLLLQLFTCKADAVIDKALDQPALQEELRPLNQDTIDYIMGHFDPGKDSRFTLIDIQYADRAGLYMRKEAYDAFVKMYDAALANGIKLIIRSATRNFNYQKGIWERKWTGETKLSQGLNAATQFSDPVQRALEILKNSSMPGSSRHHWGTDIDFNSFENNWFESGEGLKLFNWLEQHAPDYGFCRPYTSKDDSRPDGYNEEKWHWSYTPIANDYTKYAKSHLKDNMIIGFQGSETAPLISVVDKYVLGIHSHCKKYK